MRNNEKKKPSLTHFACIIIMMLKEEKESFLAHNKRLLINGSKRDDGYTEFIFFDKEGRQRKGLICSGDQEMGNTEACELFYKISRKYTADLYINLGVAGYIKDVQIGDVIVVKRISTLGEGNASDSPWQLLDGPSQKDAVKIQQGLCDTCGEAFIAESSPKLSQFRTDIQEESNLLEEEKNEICGPEDRNQIRSGWCVTVPEVIKTNEESEQNSRFPVLRKCNVMDMEAYYFVHWHELIKKVEPEHSCPESKFIIFKSASDMANKHKAVVEKCGSRDLAMANLCFAVCAYLTDVHEFPQNPRKNKTLLNYFNEVIYSKSRDSLLLPRTSKGQSRGEQAEEQNFGKLCRYFISTTSAEELRDEEDSVAAACNLLTSGSNTLLLSGHSGTGKSTFVSYVYRAVKHHQKNAILVDFSKFSHKTMPTDEQVIYLLEKLLSQSQNNVGTVFLDGISLGYEKYDRLLAAVNGHQNAGPKYRNLSLCISDESDDRKHTNERVATDFRVANSRLIECAFRGISVYSPDLRPTLQSAETYFKSIHKEFDAEAILQFIQNSALNHIDFRLLKMFADHAANLRTADTFPQFINQCCAKKADRAVFSRFFNFAPFQPSEYFLHDDKEKKAYQALYRNSYMKAFLFATCIGTIVTARNNSEIQKLLQSNYILSDEMNLFLDDYVSEAQQGNDFVEVLIPILQQNSNTTCSAETQLIYSIMQTEGLRNHSYLRRQCYDYIKKKIEKAKQIISDCKIAGQDYYERSLQYRTLAILLWRNRSGQQHDRSYLDSYNQSLLNDQNIKNCNLYFHLYYYSRREFTLDEINLFDKKSISEEMFLNTYYTLLHALNIDGYTDTFEREITRRNPFYHMNLITFACLIEAFMVHEKKYRPFFDQTVKYLKTMTVVVHKCNQSPQCQDFDCHVESLLDTTLKKLQNN